MFRIFYAFGFELKTWFVYWIAENWCLNAYLAAGLNILNIKSANHKQKLEIESIRFYENRKA